MPRKPPQFLRHLLPVAAALSLGCVALASPNAPVATVTPVSVAASSAAPARPAIPDYGGRNGALGSTLEGTNPGAAQPDPLAQAGKAFEALVIVLLVVAGGLALLKRSGLL